MFALINVCFDELLLISRPLKPGILSQEPLYRIQIVGKQLTLVLLLSVVCNSVFAQDQLYSQFYPTYLYMNPGFAGAIGEKKIFHIQDEQRAVDYAMGLVARAWGRFPNFQANMLARQNQEKVDLVSKPIEVICPRCGGPIPVDVLGMFTCKYCGTTLKI